MVSFRCKDWICGVFFIRIHSNQVHLEDERDSTGLHGEDESIGDNLGSNSPTCLCAAFMLNDLKSAKRLMACSALRSIIVIGYSINGYFAIIDIQFYVIFLIHSKILKLTLFCYYWTQKWMLKTCKF